MPPPRRESCWSAWSSRTRSARAPRWSCRRSPSSSAADDVVVELPATATGPAAGRGRRAGPPRRRHRPRDLFVGAGPTVQLDVQRVGPARRRTTRGCRPTDTVTPVGPHLGALDRAGRAAGRTATGPLLAGPDRGRGPARHRRDRPVRGPVRPRRVRRGDVPGARRPSRSSSPTRSRPRSASAVGDELDARPGRGPGARSSSTGWSPTCPGCPTGAAVLVDRDLLTRAALLGSSTDPLLDEWWLQVPDASAPALVEEVRARGPRRRRRPGDRARGGHRRPAARRRAGGAVDRDRGGRGPRGRRASP